MLRSRIQRLEARVRCQAGPPGTSNPAVVWTTATCVKALRTLLTLLAAESAAMCSDPYPELEGEDYLLAFWPWLLAHGERWPLWARAYAHQICAIALRDAGRVPLPRTSGRLQTPRDVIDLLAEQVEAVRAEDRAETVAKARALGYLAGQARKAMETGQVADRIDMLAKVLKQRQGEERS
jgi:hypothetical protein